MPWVKHGLVIEPRGQAAWIGTHAALPIIQSAPHGDHIYFCSRDRHNRAHIGRATVTLDRPMEPLRADPVPLLFPGPLGTFDDAGVTTACLVSNQGRLFLFYTGWALGVTVPFYLHAGLAVSDDGGASFTRLSRAPLLDRTDVDPFLTASPWVLVEDGRWRMWYVSGTGWQPGEQGPRHWYHIKYAESSDGLRWERQGHVCVDFASPDEHAFGRPCVVKDGDRYRMWYSVRGTRYRMGYAESDDGLTWTRRDDLNVLDVSESGWDAEMVTYPVVFVSDGQWRMLYNGNGFGRTGIGLATLSGTLASIMKCV